jgi:NAD(P)-dependent dehydrogenase (short-subunit alcohol dehydrogenase family)
MLLKGKCALISGANQGFGYAVAQMYLQEGANVVIAARDKQLLEDAQQKLGALTNNHVIAITADISKPRQVEQLVDQSIDTLGRLDILIANAGVYGPKGAVEKTSWAEWSAAIDINLKGTVLQCREVLPYFKRQQHGKIIILSGGGATKPLPYLSAYAASKAGVVRFCETLALEVKDDGIDVNAVAPGALNTRLLDEIINAGPEKVGQAFYQQALKQQADGGTSLEKGASLCAFLGSVKSNAISGKLISALWDPWQELPQYLRALQSTDIYTLRRIVPKERSMIWGEVK